MTDEYKLYLAYNLGCFINEAESYALYQPNIHSTLG